MADEELHLAEVGNFFGVYILNCKSPEHKGDVYIGFTVNPTRRIRQHNREIKGGAWKTGKNKGNWDMVLIVHGFRSKIAALQFEWAWQNPLRSKRLNHLKKKVNSEKKFAYKLRILSEMLNTGPWKRLPLTIQWLKQEYHQHFPIGKPPPMHMPIAYGQLRMAKKVSDTQSQEEDKTDVDTPSSRNCNLCNTVDESTETKFLICIVKSCNFIGHMKCFAELFLREEKHTKKENSFLIPVSGRCPGCKQELLWGDLVRQRRYSLEEEEGDEENSESGTEEELEFSQEEEDNSDDDEFQ